MEFEVAVHVGTDTVAVVGPAVLAPQTRLAHSNGNSLENNTICAHLFVRQKDEQIGQLSITSVQNETKLIFTTTTLTFKVQCRLNGVL